MSIFEQVAALFTARQTQRVSGFDDLARTIADGNPPSPEAIAAALEEFGRTPDDLQREVTRRQQRAEFARRLAEVPALQEEAAELKRKGAAEVAQHEAIIKPLVEEHRRNIKTLDGRYLFLMARIPESESMKDKLLASYRGPLTTELDENRAKQARLNREIHKILETAKRHEHATSFTRREESCVQTVHERRATYRRYCRVL